MMTPKMAVPFETVLLNLDSDSYHLKLRENIYSDEPYFRKASTIIVINQSLLRTHGSHNIAETIQLISNMNTYKPFFRQGSQSFPNQVLYMVNGIPVWDHTDEPLNNINTDV
ncbi:MAG: hypothetical protein HRT90_06065, partial [Candidatus Margulisbacteria bacterium]|nr:hypothetical protein [Candidatus Margulisiibacteriota bacterium]